MMFSIIRKIRKSYAKLTQIMDKNEKEMKEWAQEDPEVYALFVHQRFFLMGGDISGLPFNQ